MTIFLTHNRVKLALHHLRSGAGQPLLHLHALGEHSPGHVPADIESWPGPVFALDFTGHGASTVPGGGGYTSEVLMGDADAALQMLGTATVVGRGLGAYIALLIAGGRPQQVRGAILCDGAGLVGGGGLPQLGGGGHKEGAKGCPIEEVVLCRWCRQSRAPPATVWPLLNPGASMKVLILPRKGH